MSSNIAIGIDIGITNLRAAVYHNGKVEMIKTKDGDQTIPCVVAFTDNECLVGAEAENQIEINPKNTIFGIRRLIGRTKNEEVVKYANSLPYEVTFDNDRKPVVNVQFKGEAKQFSPEEILAKLLKKMKETAEVQLCQKIEMAVITIQAYYYQNEYRATTEAAKIAGFDNVWKIKKPIAAFNAFCHQKEPFSKTTTFLVYDLGSKVFNVSIVQHIANQSPLNISLASMNTDLGGIDVDEKLMNHCAEVFEKEHGIDISNDARAKWRLRKACEEAKKNLSVKIQEDILVEALFGGIDFKATISRTQLEEICSDLFERTVTDVQEYLKDSKLEKSDIEAIILVGQSTKIPKIQQSLKDFFDGKVPFINADPDEVVVHGTAISASFLSESSSD